MRCGKLNVNEEAASAIMRMRGGESVDGGRSSAVVESARGGPSRARLPCLVCARGPGVGPVTLGHLGWPYICSPGIAGMWPNRALANLFLVREATCGLACTQQTNESRREPPRPVSGNALRTVSGNAQGTTEIPELFFKLLGSVMVLLL